MRLSGSHWFINVELVEWESLIVFSAWQCPSQKFIQESWYKAWLSPTVSSYCEGAKAQESDVVMLRLERSPLTLIPLVFWQYHANFVYSPMWAYSKISLILQTGLVHTKFGLGGLTFIMSYLIYITLLHHETQVYTLVFIYYIFKHKTIIYSPNILKLAVCKYLEEASS